MFQYKLIFWICFALFNSCKCAEFPADIERCVYGDGECIAKVTNGLLRSFPNGRDDVGFPSLDPLHVNSLEIDEGSGGPVNFKLKLTNTTVEGFSTLTFNNIIGFKKDPRASKFEMMGKIPKLRFKGLYKTSGRILVLPVDGEGGYEFTVENVEALIKFKPTIITKDDKKYLQINKLKIFATTTKLTMDFKNLFNGDKVLGDNINLFLNENWEDVWGELSRPIFPAMSEVIKMILKPIFADYSYEDIFLRE